MGSMGFSDYAPSAQITLASDATKVSPTPSTSDQLEHTLAISPTTTHHVVRYEYIEEGYAGDNTSGINTRTLTGSYTTTVAGAAESAKTSPLGDTVETLASRCTTDTYNTSSSTLSTPFYGGWGKTLTVKTYLRADSAPVTLTAMCSKNVVVKGRQVLRKSKFWGNSFPGSF